MDLTLYRKIIDQVAHRVDLVALTSSGEPLLCEDLPLMVDYAKQQGLRVVTTTNGLLLNPNRAKQLLDAGLDELRISVDGASKGTYERIRTDASYDKLMQNLSDLQNIRFRYGSCKIDIHFVLQRHNLNDFGALASTYARLADTLSVSLLKTFGYQELLGLAIVPMQAPIACNLLYTMPTVLWDGVVSICCNNHSRRDLLGNVQLADIGALWNCALYKHYRQLHLTNRFERIALCSGCFFPDLKTEWMISGTLLKNCALVAKTGTSR